MVVRMEEVLWQLSKYYCRKLNTEHPGAELSPDVAAMALLCALERSGDAVQNICPEGIVTWRATTKFLRDTGLETGPLVTLQSTLN
jgi:hypothetical protein